MVWCGVVWGRGKQTTRGKRRPPWFAWSFATKRLYNGSYKKKITIIVLLSDLVLIFVRNLIVLRFVKFFNRYRFLSFTLVVMLTPWIHWTWIAEKRHGVGRNRNGFNMMHLLIPWYFASDKFKVCAQYTYIFLFIFIGIWRSTKTYLLVNSMPASIERWVTKCYLHEMASLSSLQIQHFH